MVLLFINDAYDLLALALYLSICALIIFAYWLFAFALFHYFFV